MAKKLTRGIIQRLINEEKAKLLETLEQGAKTPSDAAKKTKEVDADKMADTLATDLDHYKAMKIHEEKLVKQLKAIREVKSLLKKRLLRNID
tara:strand:- start:973 stop:1248 length:276 start_codon:yes stop_codon:yes gene_type:complete